MGRRRLERWGPRTLDIDILTYGGAMIDESDLKIPHPRTTERAFVLTPLAEIAPQSFGSPIGNFAQACSRSRIARASKSSRQRPSDCAPPWVWTAKNYRLASRLPFAKSSDELTRCARRAAIATKRRKLADWARRDRGSRMGYVEIILTVCTLSSPTVCERARIPLGRTDRQRKPRQGATRDRRMDWRASGPGRSSDGPAASRRKRDI